MTKTMQDLAVRVLIELKQTNATEQPEHEDAELVKEYYQNKLSELTDNGHAYWKANEIPDAAFIGLSKVVANEAQEAFGVQYTKGQEGFDAIVAHSSKQLSGGPIKIGYF